MFGKKKILGQKNCVSKKNWIKRFFGLINVWVKKILNQKKVGVKNFLGHKNFGSKNILGKNFWFKKNLVKKIWIQTLFCLKGRVNPRWRIYDPPPGNSRVKIVLDCC